jgi:O-acetyl-ADP-ribose deacetylase (regulator of RNase III)
MNYQANHTKVVIQLGDITEQNTEAIVNAANSHLQHGGGVAGAIVRKGGRIIQEESDRVGYTPTGTAAITGAGALKSRYVIHAVGPVMGEGEEDKKLESATLSSLQLADKNKIQSISFPAISTGIFGYPIDRCANVMLCAVREYCNGNTEIREIRFCLFDQNAHDVFTKAADTILRT